MSDTVVSCGYRVWLPQLGEIVCNIQPHFLVVSQGYRFSTTFDREGRLHSAFWDGTNYTCGMDGRVLVRSFASDGGKVRRLLPPDEAAQVRARVAEHVAVLRHLLPPDAPPLLRGWLEQAQEWDSARLEAAAARFEATYAPIGILPPDQYRAVVLQATEGCTWNRCTFCSLYAGRAFRVKSPAEFRAHAQQVRALFGRAIGLRSSLFLADANALAISQERVRALLKVAHEEFVIGGDGTGTGGGDESAYVLDGIYSFLDIFGGEQKHTDDYRELHDAQVRRLYIGLESGDPQLFALLNKPGSPAACIDLVRNIKAAGISVGVIVLAGAGGDRFAPQHVQATLATLRAMPLDARDIVYLSPLVVSGSEGYVAHMRELGARLLTEAELRAQVASFKQALKQAWPRPPRVTLYHLEEFLY